MTIQLLAISFRDGICTVVGCEKNIDDCGSRGVDKEDGNKETPRQSTACTLTRAVGGTFYSNRETLPDFAASMENRQYYSESAVVGSKAD